MARQWEDSVKNRNPKELTVFVTSKVTGSWRTACNDAIAEFNQLSTTHTLGVSLAVPQNATAPDPDGEGGADLQFDVGKGTLTCRAFGQEFKIPDFSGTALHGHTHVISRGFGNQPPRVRRAFIFVPETPMVSAPLKL